MNHTATQLSHLTNAEFLDRLYYTSQDPVIHRLIGMVLTPDGLYNELVSAGMDPDTETFSTKDWTLWGDHMSPGEYIQHLEKTVDYQRQEANDMSHRVDELEQEVNRLSTRSVVEMMQSMLQEHDQMANKLQRAHQDITDAEARADHLSSQLDMWTKLQRTY
jgi:uncharacterized protein YdcH (DUF465 family)